LWELNAGGASLQQSIHLARIKMRDAHNHGQTARPSGGDQVSCFLFSDLRVFQVADSKVQPGKRQNLNDLTAAKFYKRSYDGAGIQLLA